MPAQLKGSREWRVTLATKWAYLDHLEVAEIVDKFEETHGIDLAESTVRDYLDEKEAAEVEEQIKEQHANARLKIAEREEQAFQRARTDEERAVQDEPVMAVVPKMNYHGGEDPISVHDWETVGPDHEDYPEWAQEWPDDRVMAITFTGGRIQVVEGQAYPAGAQYGMPQYTQKPVGFRPDQPDLTGRSASRREQSAHLENMGEVLGVYEEHINLDVEEERSIDEEDKGEIVEAIEGLRDGDADNGGE